MIKVIKHGHAPYLMTCKNCECVFTFDDSDIKNNGCQQDWKEYICCPECECQNTMYSRKNYSNYLTEY